MRRVRVEKAKRDRDDDRSLPLPLGLRDPEIVRAKRVTAIVPRHKRT